MNACCCIAATGDVAPSTADSNDSGLTYAGNIAPSTADGNEPGTALGTEEAGRDAARNEAGSTGYAGSTTGNYFYSTFQLII